MKNFLKSVSVLTLLVVLTGCAGFAEADSGQVTAEINTLQATVVQLTKEKTDLETMVQNSADDNEKLKGENQKLEDDGQKVQGELEAANSRIQEFTVLEEKYRGLSESEADAQVAANELKANEDKLAKEEALAKEAEDAAKRAEDESKKAEDESKEAEAEAKKGYDTGITFNQLARTPDDYFEKKVKFTGEVVQVMDGDEEINLRVAVNGDYDKVVLVFYPSTLLDERVLEDDKITLYGTSQGLHTYESTMGGEITIPLIQGDKVDIK